MFKNVCFIFRIKSLKKDVKSKFIKSIFDNVQVNKLFSVLWSFETYMSMKLTYIFYVLPEAEEKLKQKIL